MPAYAMRMVSKVVIGIVIGVAAIIVLVLVGVSLFQDRLRGYVERELNSRVDRYDIRIDTLTVHPLMLAVDIERLTVRLKEHPDHPLIDMPRAGRIYLARAASWHAGRCDRDGPSDCSSHAGSSDSSGSGRQKEGSQHRGATDVARQGPVVNAGHHVC